MYHIALGPNLFRLRFVDVDHDAQFVCVSAEPHNCPPLASWWASGNEIQVALERVVSKCLHHRILITARKIRLVSCPRGVCTCWDLAGSWTRGATEKVCTTFCNPQQPSPCYQLQPSTLHSQVLVVQDAYGNVYRGAVSVQKIFHLSPTGKHGGQEWALLCNICKLQKRCVLRVLLLRHEPHMQFALRDGSSATPDPHTLSSVPNPSLDSTPGSRHNSNVSQNEAPMRSTAASNAPPVPHLRSESISAIGAHLQRDVPPLSPLPPEVPNGEHSLVHAFAAKDLLMMDV